MNICKQISQIIIAVDLIGFAGLNNAKNNATGFGAFFGIIKKPILTTYHEWFNTNCNN
jgi:hypothetical protein